MVSASRVHEMSDEELAAAKPDSKDVIRERVRTHGTPVEPYNGEWTFWAPGVALYFETRHETLAAATIAARRGPLCATVERYTNSVRPIPPYRCDECNQGYESREEYVEHLEFYAEWACDHPEYENKHPDPEAIEL